MEFATGLSGPEITIVLTLVYFGLCERGEEVLGLVISSQFLIKKLRLPVSNLDIVNESATNLGETYVQQCMSPG